MIKKVDLGPSSGHHGVFGNPAPLGLLGLAVSCAALTPISFGYGAGLEGKEKTAVFATVAAFVLFFGFCTHLLTGIMDFANKNVYGGTIFTTFSFNWLITSISLFATAYHLHLDHTIILATEVALMVVFVFLTYGFGFFSKALFFFLLDIDLLYACKLLKGFTGSSAFNTPIGIFTVLLGAIGLWLALAGLMNPITGKDMFSVGNPFFFATKKIGFDFTIRRNIFGVLYDFWKENAFKEMPIETLKSKIKELTGSDDIIPDLCYLMEYGSLTLTFDEKDKETVKSVRLKSGGIDLYEQLILRKYDF